MQTMLLLFPFYTWDIFFSFLIRSLFFLFESSLLYLFACTFLLLVSFFLLCGLTNPIQNVLSLFVKTKSKLVVFFIQPQG